MSNIDLKPKPPSYLGKQILFQATQCLLLPVTLLLQKHLAKILWSSFRTQIGGKILERTWIGIICKTLLIKTSLPP